MKLVEGRAVVDDVDAFLDDLRAVGDAHGVTVQAFDARHVAGRRHLERAVALADRAIDRGENVARDRAVEILLYAAGTRQIDRALELGVREGESRVVVLVAADGAGGGGGENDDAGGVAAANDASDDGSPAEREAAAARAVRERVDPAPALGEFDPALLREWFDVTDAELAAVDADLLDLVCERVALVEVEK